MEDLLVVTYGSEYDAVDNMRMLWKLDDDWIVDIHDAVAVARDSFGKLHIQDSYKATNQAVARWGVLLGTILGGLALAPFTGGLSTAAAAGVVGAGAAGGAAFGGIGGATMASWEKQTVGLSEQFVSEVSNTLGRGHSAIFALVSSGNPDRVTEYFRGTGGKITCTTLSLYEEERAQQIITGSA